MAKYYDRQTRLILNDYKNQLKHFIVTSRFTNTTWLENENYRKKFGEKLGCIYCSPDPVSIQIPIDSILFVLEMNNDLNRIMGIGMIRNHHQINRHHVYDSDNYNRYNYSGKYRIDREDMVSDEEELVMTIFDKLCFTGNKHMKRGQGLKSFPIDILYRCKSKIDLVESVCKMFKRRITERAYNNDNNDRGEKLIKNL